MGDFPMISDHSMLLQGHGMFSSAEGCLGTRRSSAAVLSTGGGGKPVPVTQDDRSNKGDDHMFFSDWPELVGFDDLEASLRDFDPTSEIGTSDYFEDILWSSNCSPEAQLVQSGYSDDIDFSVDRNDDSNTLKANTTKTRQQSRRNGASISSGTSASNYDARVISSSSGLWDAQLVLPLHDTSTTALARQQMGGWDWEGLEALLCSSPEMRALPAASIGTMCTDASSTCCSSGPGPDTAAAHLLLVPPSATKTTTTKDPLFSGAPDIILEEMAENPLDMYFPPLATAYEQQPAQPRMLMGDTTTSAPKHRFPEEFVAGSCALECAELNFCSEDTACAGLHGRQQPASSAAVVLDAVPVKNLCFQKLQYVMNQLDLATKGRIRDSLYRLANGVEQRHCVGSTGGGLGSSGPNRFESGGWTESQTNVMDQEVARLLLHKPSYRRNAPPHRVT